jgi:hypothetical protein
MENKEILKYLENEFLLNDTDLAIDNVADWIQQELDKAREEGKREVYEAIVFDENIPHDITTFVAANLWKNMRDKAKEELSKLKE